MRPRDKAKKDVNLGLSQDIASQEDTGHISKQS